MSAVEVDGLTLRYGPIEAVRDLSFTAEAGQVTCLLGRNGAGKTSTIEALEGLRRPVAGRLSVVGLDPQRDQKTLATRIGVMLQEVGIHPAVRVGEIVRHGAALYPRALDPSELITRVGLGGLERRTFRQLSGGEQRRLALALALVGRPQVAFLDEPTTGVDPAGRQVIRELVGELRDDGVTVLLSTHELDEAERMADRFLIIDGGRLRAEGTLDQLTRSDGDQIRFRTAPGLDADGLIERLGGLEVAVVIEPSPGEYLVTTVATPSAIAAIAAWLAEHDLALTDLRTGHSLEDVFLDLTGSEA
jgi:ABC-2 type transport system ATP-binding protein